MFVFNQVTFCITYIAECGVFILPTYLAVRSNVSRHATTQVGVVTIYTLSSMLARYTFAFVEICTRQQQTSQVSGTVF